MSASLPDVRRLSHTLSDVSNALVTDRFQFVSKEAEDLQKGFVPGNTQRSMQWAIKSFSDWKKAREFALEEACPEDLLERANPEDLVRWLSLFAAEAQNGKGDHYTPATISSLLVGLLQTMRSINTSVPNFLDKKDPCFKLLHNSLDNLYRKLRTMNIATVVKQAEVFTKEENQGCG